MKRLLWLALTVLTIGLVARAQQRGRYVVVVTAPDGLEYDVSDPLPHAQARAEAKRIAREDGDAWNPHVVRAAA